VVTRGSSRAGRGNELVDVDGRRYLDFVGSWGPLLFGHADPDVVEAAVAAVKNGSSFGAPTEAEVLFAEELCQAHPVLEQVRLCSSGTEATMHALRLARGFTGRDSSSRSTVASTGPTTQCSLPRDRASSTYARPARRASPQRSPDSRSPRRSTISTRCGSTLSSKPVAALIVEPVPGNMGCIAPEPGYLEGLREITRSTERSSSSTRS
jgi:glutamate-1-semialdehyde 2,1-aminomutase